MKHTGSLAIVTDLLSMDTTCVCFIHQPKVPEYVKNINDNIKEGE